MHATFPGSAPSLSGEFASAAFVLEPPRHARWQPAVVSPGKYIVGSAPDCQIVLPVEGILPHHALLIVSERKTLLKAWDDRTWINDWPVKESVVKLGDRISFGPVTCRWRAATAEDLPSIIAPPVETVVAPIPPSDPVRQALSAPLDEQVLASLRPELPPPTVVESQRQPEQAPIVSVSELDDRLSCGSDSQRTERETDLMRQAAELSRRERLCEARSAELTRRTAAFEQQIAEFERQLAQTARDQAARLEESNRREADLAAREDSYEQLNASASQFAAELHRRQLDFESTLADRQRQFDADATALKIERERFDQAVIALQSEREALTRQNHDADIRTQSLEDQSRLLAAHEQRLAERDAELSDRQRELETLHTELALDQAALLAAMNRLADERQASCEELACIRSELEQKRTELTGERESLHAERATFVERRQELDEQNLSLDAGKRELATLKDQFAAGRAAFDAEQVAWNESLARNSSSAERREREAQAEEARLSELAERLQSEQQRLDSQAAQIAKVEQELAQRHFQLQTERDSFAAEQAEALQVANERHAWLTQFQADVDAERVALAGLSEALSADRGQLQSERDELTAQQTQFAAERRELAAERARLTEQIATLAVDRTQLQTEHQWLTEQIRQHTQQRQQLEAERLTLQSDQVRLEEEIRRQSDRQQQLDTEHGRLADEFRSLADKNAQLVAERNQLGSDRRELDQRAEALAADHAALQSEQARLAEENRQQAQREQALDTERSRLASDSESLIEEQQRLAAESEQLAAQRLQVDSDRCELQRRLVAVDADRAALQLEQTLLAEQVQAQDELCQKLDAERAALVEQSMRLTTDREQMADERRWLDSERERLAAQSAAVIADRERLQTEQERLADQIEGHAVERDGLARLRTELELGQVRLTESVQQLLSDEKLSAAQNSEVEKLAAQLESDAARLSAERAALEREQSNLRSEQTRWNEASEEHSRRLSGQQSQLAARETELHEQLAELTRRQQEFEAAKFAASETPVIPADIASAEETLRREIERLNSELAQAEEFRGALDMQLAELKRLKEQDDIQWQSVCTDWRLQQEQLEREVAELKQELIAECARNEIQIPPLSVSDEPANRIEDDAPLAKAPVASELLSEADAMVTDADGQTNPGDSVNQLRAKLAQMFDLPASPDRNPDQGLPPADSARSSAEAPPVPENLLFEQRSFPAPDVSWRTQLGALLSDAEPEATASATSPEPITAACEAALSEGVSAEPDKSDEEDSIASYMERLLARNKRGSEDAPEERPTTERKSKKTVEATPAAKLKTSADLQSRNEEVTAETPAAEPRRERKPRTEPVKDLAREHLDVFRQVANVSARAAVAQHTSKNLRNALIARGVVTSLSAAAGLAFFTASAFFNAPYHPQTVGCLLIAGLGAADFLRNMVILRTAAMRLDSIQLRGTPASAVSGETASAATNDPAAP